MFIQNKKNYFILFLTLIFLCSCSTSKPPLTEAKKNYFAGDYTPAFNKLLPQANNGNPEAQYAIGYMYYYGLGVAKDQDIGRIWISKAANKGFYPAMLAMKKINQARGFKRGKHERSSEL